MFDDVRQLFVDWINDFLSHDLLPEAITLVLILIFGLILEWTLRAVLNRLERALEKSPAFTYAPWLQAVFKIGRVTLRPFSIWLVGKGFIRLMGASGQPHGLLDYALSFVGLWLVYKILSELLVLLLEPEKLHFWQHQVLRPTFILLAAMHAVGVLDEILNTQINLGKGILVTVGALLAGMVVLFVFILLGRYVRGLLRDVILPGMDADPSLIPIVATFSGYLVIVAGMLIGLYVAGVDLTGMAIILGGLSVGIGFGMQELVNNFVSGFILLFERSLMPGDRIHTAKVSGVVEDIRLRTTHIRTFDNVQQIVPNGKLLSDVLSNYSQDEGARRKRIRIDVSASYDNDPNEVMAALVETAKHHHGVLEYPEPQVLLTEFDDDGLNYNLRAWVADTSQMDSVASELRLLIWNMFAARRFEMPYPQRDVHLVTGNGNFSIAKE